VSRYVPAQKVEKRAVVYGDPKTAELFQLATRVARSEATVMVTGPSGTGKEVLARYIHDNSSRAEQPFVAINCAAIPENMLEATLFGYEKGAFTGAVQGCPGKFEQAQGGTLLLDEITEMDQGLQAKLLRVLQEKEVERLGSRKMIPLDVRVIATSNRDLKKAVQDGLFREDLYYRLNVFPLRWSALCERPGDILPLAEHLLALHASQQGLPTPQLTDASRDRLLAHPWPGNVRELDNVVQRALILSPDGVIDCDHLILEELDEQEMEFVSVERSYGGDRLGSELKQQEHQIILDTLQDCNGSRKAVADRLGISPRTLRYKLAQMREAGIDLPA
ncbi:MAG: sigma-54 interaction domain-containing protein, partial [Aeromonas veronii]